MLVARPFAVRSLSSKGCATPDESYQNTPVTLSVPLSRQQQRQGPMQLKGLKALTRFLRANRAMGAPTAFFFVAVTSHVAAHKDGTGVW